MDEKPETEKPEKKYRARQATEPEQVGVTNKTLQARLGLAVTIVNANKGDYIVTDKDGRKSVYPPDRFEYRFQPTEIKDVYTLNERLRKFEERARDSSPIKGIAAQRDNSAPDNQSAWDKFKELPGHLATTVKTALGISEVSEDISWKEVKKSLREVARATEVVGSIDVVKDGGIKGAEKGATATAFRDAASNAFQNAFDMATKDMVRPAAISNADIEKTTKASLPVLGLDK